MPTSIKLDAEIKDRLGHLAERRQRSAHWLMREAIREYIEREENRDALRCDAIQAWQDYQTSGQHLTLEEADVWLAKLEAGEEVAPPECHD